MATNSPRPPFGDRPLPVRSIAPQSSGLQRFFDDRCIDLDPSLPAVEAVAEWLDITRTGQSADFSFDEEKLFYESGSGRTRLETMSAEELSEELQTLIHGRLDASQRVAILYAVGPWDEESRDQQHPFSQFSRLHHEVEVFCLGGTDVVLLTEEQARLLEDQVDDEAPVAVFAVPETSAPEKLLKRQLRALLPDQWERELYVDHLARLTQDLWAGCQSAAVYFRKGEDGRTYAELDVTEYPSLSDEALNLIGAQLELAEGRRVLRRYVSSRRQIGDRPRELPHCEQCGGELRATKVVLQPFGCPACEPEFFME